MCNQSEWIVREAFLAYDKGDVIRMLEFVDPDLKWTYITPARGPADTSRADASTGHITLPRSRTG